MKSLIEKLKAARSKALKDERKLKSSRFNIGKVIIIGFWAFVGIVALMSYLSFTRVGFLNTKINGYQAEAKEKIESLNESGFITSPAAEDYAKRFIKEYITIPADSKEREERSKVLSGYLADGLKLENMEDIAGFQGKRALNDMELYSFKDIKNNKATILFRVDYSSVPIVQEVITKKVGKGKEAKEVKEKVFKEKPAVRKGVIIAVPIATDGANFNVIEQPYLKQLPEETKLAAVKNEDIKSERNYKDELALKEFTADFLKSLTENTVNEMGYLMDQPESLQGVYEFMEIKEFTLYNGTKGAYKIKAYVDFKEVSSGIVTRQPLTMTVINNNGKYFVKKIKHTIGG